MKVVEPPFKKRKLINGNEEIVNNNVQYNNNCNDFFLSTSLPIINKCKTQNNVSLATPFKSNKIKKQSYLTKIKNNSQLPSDIIIDNDNFSVDKLIKEPVIYIYEHHDDIENIEEYIKNIINNIAQYMSEPKMKQKINEYPHVDIGNNADIITESDFDSSFMNYGSEYINKSESNVDIYSSSFNNIQNNSQYYDKFGTSNDGT